VRSIVSDIDDAPIVTPEDNRQLAISNEAKKAKLKVAKDALTEVQSNIRTLAPMVEEGPYPFLRTPTLADNHR
jgi:hypothetical protein